MPAKLPVDYSSDAEGVDRDSNVESGYVSASSSEESLPEITFTDSHLKFLNRQLQFLEPQGM